MNKRVVITGCGCVTPFGYGKDVMWKSLLDGKNGISQIMEESIGGNLVNIAGCLPNLSDLPDNTYEKLEMDDDSRRFMYAIDEAIREAGLCDSKLFQTSSAILAIADRKPSLIQYVDRLYSVFRESANMDDYDAAIEQGLSKLNGSNHFYHESISHIVAQILNFKGIHMSMSTACASGNNAIGESFYKIKNGMSDIAIAGGAYNFDLSIMAGFSRLGALTHNQDPAEASRPFDKDRDGFVMSSGCGIVILEEYKHALARNAKIYGEIVGYSSFCDAYRATDSDEKAECATKSIREAIKLAGISPSEIGYINAHGTSTVMNDLMETRAIKNVFGKDAYKIPISSTKSMLGHSIMAAAAIEAVVCVMSLNDSYVHMTRNCCNTEGELDLDYVQSGKRKVNSEYALSNSFGFGGQNTTIVIKRCKV